ncbi:aldolase [Aureimonas jatrophae]|uniref:3-oxo-tetronate 4-phosphate decarboxylase n=1 Tax=Aureimonas jatrophae TaxID=1166073 RepID=A0A1H0LXA6_9HYPH|nr:aldolase [Aureimonas jatrophae]MBB3953083.1 ribulose-5-phosphate 4-epimerase/fuculose-1-phosphate aldolase [Aureimonas jatrophae]SDO65302.1 Ribulose-5-phosphate 4-epimerase/Fuculose-1-phosphate aldolase [Aureimonas jatrophae]SDO72852.1 Ribulose-5-phosphate 4-epimerase/Fuculose-1-phosphate aldolase [Aureimonas jatrophae]SDO87034.1 Ribulose-5-phosphate 4-epimerase/Fuculose-1-phosphate aldolase [Aureimonas jatrophae]
MSGVIASDARAESQLREDVCRLAASLFDRGLTQGASGNVSVRLPDGGLLVTPTGRSLGRLDPGRLARLGADGQLVSGDAPTKEVPLHAAFYQTRGTAGAVVHLHSAHAVAWSTLPEVDPENALPAITPYAVMLLGRVKLLPFFVPGDPLTGEAIRGLGGRRSAVLLANHGPVVASRDLEAAVNAMEELEATARLALLTRGHHPRLLSEGEVARVVKRFDVEWDG